MTGRLRDGLDLAFRMIGGESTIGLCSDTKPRGMRYQKNTHTHTRLVSYRLEQTDIYVTFESPTEVRVTANV